MTYAVVVIRHFPRGRGRARDHEAPEIGQMSTAGAEVVNKTIAAKESAKRIGTSAGQITHGNDLYQGWANYGPPEHFVRPVNTCRNFHVFNLL